MSNNLTFGVEIKGTGSGGVVNDARKTRDELVGLKRSTDELAVSSSKMASQYSGMNVTFKSHSAAVTETDGKVLKLLNRYDPLGAKLKQLQTDFNALNRAAAGGMVSGKDDARVDMVYARMQSQIRAASAATVEYGVVAKKTALSAGQLRMATQQLPMQFTDIWVSLAAGQSPMMVMLQQGTQIKDSFGGIGAAAAAMGKYILGLVNPFTVMAATLAAGAYAFYRFENQAVESTEKVVEAIQKAHRESGRIASMSRDALATEIAASEDLIRTYEAYSSHLRANITRFNWRDSAAQIALYAAEIEKANARLAELKSASNDAPGKEVDKLREQSSYARRESLVKEIELLRTYNATQQAGSREYLTSLSAIQDKKSQLAAMDKKSSGSKLLEEVRRFDEQMVVSHEDAFAKTLIGWRKLQDDMIAAGKYGAEQRAAHEAVYFDFVNDEFAKREGEAEKHTAVLREKQQVKFTALQIAADEAGMTDEQRRDAKYQRDLDSLERERVAMAGDHKLTLAETEAFEQAKADITTAYLEQKMRSENSVANFSKLLRKGDFTDAMSMAQQMSAGLATHSRAAFEINKMASLAKATVSGYQMIQAAAADGAEWGGYAGAIIEGGLAAAYVAANISAINSTKFGGGGSVSAPGGGGVPSLSTATGTPVSVQPSQDQKPSITIYVQGNVLTDDWIDQYVTPQVGDGLRDQITNGDYLLIDPRSRQASVIANANT